MDIETNTLITNIAGGLATALPLIITIIMARSGVIQQQGMSLRDAYERITKLEAAVRDQGKKEQVLWSYLLEVIESHGRYAKPPDPPKELESDPELTEIFRKIKNRRKKPR